MSRCFPFRPPCYEEGLIESIKKEREKAKEERRKEKKREKKEKREKAGQEHEKSERTKHSHKKRKHEERNQLDQKDCYNAKAKATADAVEQLEKSGLTEEHERPCSVQHNYDSSESSQDSSKRRKLVATTVNQSNQASHGSILRIRLPLVKQKGAMPPAGMPIAKLKVLTPPAIMTVLKQRDPEPAATMSMVKEKDLKPPATMLTLNQTDLERSRTSEKPCFSGRVTEAACELDAANSYSKSSSKRKGRIHEMERQFRELIIDWKPPPFHLEHSDIGDQDWLFGSAKRHSSHNADMFEAGKKSSSHETSVPSSLQPQACYLPDCNTYQLPYVVPY